MKLTYLLPIFFLLATGCGSKSDNSKTSDTVIESQQSTNKKFFDYDEIVHYYNPFDESKIVELIDRQSNSELDSIKSGIILGGIPKDISDLSFIDKLERIGFTKTNLDKSKFAAIDTLFIEKSPNEVLAMSCIYVFRDILIFRKENKVIGTAKICFSCMAHEITGTKKNTDNFGQDGDYGRLFNLLHKQ